MAYKPGDDIVSTSIVFKIASFIVFYILLYPLAWIVCKLWYRFKIHGQQNLKGISKAVSVSGHYCYSFFPKKSSSNFTGSYCNCTLLGNFNKVVRGGSYSQKRYRFCCFEKRR